MSEIRAYMTGDVKVQRMFMGLPKAAWKAVCRKMENQNRKEERNGQSRL
jgi:hypothetical protein